MHRYGFVLAATAAVLTTADFAAAERIYGMTAASSGSTQTGQSLVFFDSSTPGSVATVAAFSGITPGHGLRNLDFRPATGGLYAISTSLTELNQARLYTVDLSTAALSPVGGVFTLGNNGHPVVDIDFNPVTDQIRVTTGSSNTNNNFRLSPDTGTLLSIDANLNWSPGDPGEGPVTSIVGTAHANNVVGATVTTLYAWSFQTDSLATIGGLNGSPSPDTGEMFTIASPAAFLTSNAGLDMDISGLTGTLYTSRDSAADANVMGLYTRDLTTGQETLIGNYPTGVFVTSISVVIPEPGSLVALAGAAVLGLRRRPRQGLRRS